MHWLLWQVLPLVHCVPQKPQLALAVKRLAQVPLQFTVPVGQLHWLLSQTRFHDAHPSDPEYLLDSVLICKNVPFSRRFALAQLSLA